MGQFISLIAVFTSAFVLFASPIKEDLKQKEKSEEIQRDLSRFTLQEQIRASQAIAQFIALHPEPFAKLSLEEKKGLIDRVTSQQARSEKVYAPIVRLFADYVLKKANQNKRKLVFIARDGIPFYRVAIRLMQTEEYQKMYPGLAKAGAISLAYFSRKLVHNEQSHPELFIAYVQKELGVKEGDACYFVDIGFNGSMIDPIRKLLPGNQIDFEYLVANSEKANGFLGNPKAPFPSIFDAAKNAGAHWLEEAHHGVIASPSHLVEAEDGRIYANTLYPTRIFQDEEFSEGYLHRKFCIEAVIRAAVERPPLTPEEAEKAKALLNETIADIKNGRLPLLLTRDNKK